MPVALVVVCVGVNCNHDCVQFSVGKPSVLDIVVLFWFFCLVIRNHDYTAIKAETMAYRCGCDCFTDWSMVVYRDDAGANHMVVERICPIG